MAVTEMLWLIMIQYNSCSIGVDLRHFVRPLLIQANAMLLSVKMLTFLFLQTGAHRLKAMSIAYSSLTCIVALSKLVLSAWKSL